MHSILFLHALRKTQLLSAEASDIQDNTVFSLNIVTILPFTVINP